MKSKASSKPFVVGVLSDTHGPVPADAVNSLDGVDHILHAGDVVEETVLDTLSAIAPVTAVRGNMDRTHDRRLIHKTQYVTLAGLNIYLLHDLFQLDIDPESAGVRMVVHGHTHRAKIEWIQDVLYLNPGSAAHPRGSRPASIARVRIENGISFPRIVQLV